MYKESISKEGVDGCSSVLEMDRRKTGKPEIEVTFWGCQIIGCDAKAQIGHLAAPRPGFSANVEESLEK